MEALRRARLVWACLCLAVGTVTATLLAFSPTPMPVYIATTLWCAVWLWLPLYMRWPALGKMAALWFLGVVPLTLFTQQYSGEAAMRAAILSAAGVAVLIAAWVALGLRRPNS